MKLFDKDNERYAVISHKNITERKQIEEALQRSEQRFRSFVENLNDVLFVLTPAGVFSYVSPQWKMAFGYELSETVGQPFRDFVHPDDVPGCLEFLQQIIETGNKQSGIEYRVLCKDGTYLWYMANASLVIDPANCSQIVGVGRDITGSKQLKEELLKSESHYRLLSENASDNIWTMDFDGKFTYVSPSTYKIRGFTSDEVMGQSLAEVVAPNSLSISLEKIGQIITNARAGLPIDNVRVEVELLRKDSSTVWSEVSLNGFYSSAGTCLKIVGVTRDITERKKTEDELRKLSRAVEQSPVSIVITDSNGTIEFVNPKFTEMTGYTADEAIGQNPRILKSGNTSEKNHKDLWIAITSGETWEGEFHNKSKDGRLFWEHAVISPLRDTTGKITHYLGVKENITEKKNIMEQLVAAKELAEDATRAKSVFLANMSHEIRTPMNALIGLSGLALKADLTSKRLDYLRKIEFSSKFLLGIINDILDFSKIDAGKMVIESIDFYLEDILSHLVDVVGMNAEEKGLELLVDVKKNIPTALIGDPLRLGQILLNLAGNAIKFTESGHIVIKIELLEEERETSVPQGVMLRFTVSDTGIGMTQEQSGRLFQAFSQADGSTTRKYGGSGLGLTISKHLVEMMGGDIHLESELGRGSSFSFSARFGVQDRAKRICPEIPTNIKGVRVLVVDDNPAAREILSEVLESFSFDVSRASSGEEALAELAQAPSDAPYQLVFMDFKMPGFNGIDTAKRIRTHTGLKRIPAVLMVSAYNQEEIKSQAETAGIDAFLVKPVSPSAVFNKIMEVLGGDIASKASLTMMKNPEAMDELKNIRGAHVLLVEDNKINQQVATELLEYAGMFVTVAENGKTGLEAVQSFAYDLVIMDMQMPVMDGYTASMEIRKWEDGRSETEPDTGRGTRPRTVVVAMTAHALAGEREKCIEAGMDDYLTKPIDPPELYSMLLKWIKPGEREYVLPLTLIGNREVITIPDELPGINMKDALRHVAGNQKLLLNLLKSFNRDYRDITAIIRLALTDKNLELAERTAHTIKGIAGVLSAKDLHGAAAILEDTIRKRHFDSIDDLLATFEEKLTVVVGSIDGIASAEKVVVTDMRDTPIDAALVKLLIVKLQRMLVESDLDASDVFSEIKKNLSGVMFCEELNQLDDLIEKGAFAKAQVILAALSGKVDIMETDGGLNYVR